MVFLLTQRKERSWSASKFLKNYQQKKAAWNSFAELVHGFLDNQRAEKYIELVAKLTKTYGEIGGRMSLKFYILNAHLDEFKENMVLLQKTGRTFRSGCIGF